MDKPLLSTSLAYHPLLHVNTNEIDPDQMLQRTGIRILTYNFFLRPPPIKNNADDYKSERLDDFKERFKDFDIICFQEMFGSFHNRKEQMIQNAAECGLFYHCESPLPSFFSKYLIDGGLLIVSRFPIVESQFEPFQHGALSDSLSGKGILYAKIKVEDMIIGLFNTHFQASYFDISDSMWTFSISTRTEQSEYAINFIYDKICNWTIPERNKTKVVLVGDFNIDYYDNAEQRKKIDLPKSPFDEYKVFEAKLNMLGKAIDLCKKKFNNANPYTFGVNDTEHDKVLTSIPEINSKQTLDYLWEIIPNYSLEIFKDENNKVTNPITAHMKNDTTDKTNSKPNTVSMLQVNYDSVKVEDFTIKNRPYQQLSDHFGLSFMLEKQSP